MTQVVHGTLGISRQDGEYPHRCSKCGDEIEEEAVPLMLWNASGELMWVYCDNCDMELFGVLGLTADYPSNRAGKR